MELTTKLVIAITTTVVILLLVFFFGLPMWNVWYALHPQRRL